MSWMSIICLADSRFADLRPYFFGARSGSGCNRSFELTQHLLGRHRFGAVNADVTKEPDLILRAMNVQPPRIVAAQLWGVCDPRKKSQPEAAIEPSSMRRYWD